MEGSREWAEEHVHPCVSRGVSHQGPDRCAGAVPGRSRRRYTGPDAGSKRTTTDFDVGVLLTSAVESSGTSTFVSG